MKQDDTVFHLGDFAFAGSDYVTKILSQLNGHIILIKGNHDHFQDSLLDKFEETYSQLHIEIGNKSIYLNHYPFLNYSGSYRKNAVWQLFGHEHLGEAYLDKNIDRLKLLLPTQYDVGVDLNDYTPVSWSKVKERIEFQMLNNVNCLYWIGHPFGQLYKKSYICNVKSNIINIWRNITQKKKFNLLKSL